MESATGRQDARKRKIMKFVLPVVCAALTAALVSACGGGGSSSAPAEAPPPKVLPTPTFRVFLFVGQSTMQGADAVITPAITQDLVDAGLQTDADRSSLFVTGTRTFTGAWGSIKGHSGSYQGDLIYNGLPVKVHGPEVGFSRALGGNVGIIKYTDNYTVVEGGRSAWVKPGTRWSGWQTFVDAQLGTIGKPYTVAGIIWFQGIDDAVLGRTKAEYAADLAQVASDVRAKYGGVPFVLVHEINSPMVNAGAIAKIREVQDEFSKLPGNGKVSVDDLPLTGIHHLTAASHVVAGQRLAAEYLRLR